MGLCQITLQLEHVIRAIYRTYSPLIQTTVEGYCRSRDRRSRLTYRSTTAPSSKCLVFQGIASALSNVSFHILLKREPCKPLRKAAA